MSVHALDDLFGKLRVQQPQSSPAEGSVDFSSQHIGFAAWKQKPSDRHVSPKLDQHQLRRILEEDVDVGASPRALPQLKTAVPASIRLQPFHETVDPEAKPNLLVLVASIFHHYRQSHAGATTPDALVKSLAQYDFLMPRNPLKKVLAASSAPDERWEVFAMRPLADGPLFVERTKGYPTNPGAIGVLFEKEMTTQPRAGKYHRAYAVRSGRLGTHTLALTGELDCVHPDDASVVEITSKPEWVKRNAARDVENYIQCKLAGVETIVTGKFSATRGVRNGPVTFHKRNITFQSIEAFDGDVLDKCVAAFEYGEGVLHEVDAACTEVGQVYYASGANNRATMVREAKPGEFVFPVSGELIRELASVMAPVV